MTNIFEDEQGTFLALINQEGQYSLWPTSLEVPPGWSVAKSTGTRSECLAWIEAHWTDMRPKSLVARMDDAHAANI
jgi:MbtH protein